MSYSVEYSPELKKRYPARQKVRQKSVLSLLLLLIVSVSIYALMQGGWMQYLIPGDPEVTTSAFSALVEDVISGEPIHQSILTFCQEIISNGT